MCLFSWWHSPQLWCFCGRFCWFVAGSSYLFCRRHQCRGRWAPPRPLLQGSYQNPVQYNPPTKKERNQALRSGKNPPVFIPHMFSVYLSLPPAPSLGFFLSVALSVCLVFQGWLRFSLLFPVQPPSLLLSARVSLLPSLPLSARTSPPSVSLSLSISIQYIDLYWQDIMCVPLKHL